ncbi:MAG: hypothetical protein WC503_04350 [Candidatus Shapirobacteria bacterium]
MQVKNLETDKIYNVPGCIEQPIVFNEAGMPICRKECKFREDCGTASGDPLGDDGVTRLSKEVQH